MMTSSDFYENYLLLANKQKKGEHNFVFYENSDKLAVIVDPRYDELMESVINNFMYFMNPKGWNLMVVSHSMYEAQIKQNHPYCTFCMISESLIYYKNNVPNITIYTYNSIFWNIDFWEMMPSNQIAIFQKDCVMFNMFDDIFLEYDYGGANVYLDNFLTYFNGGINGGFSLRKKEKMIECLKKVNLEIINKHKESLCSFYQEQFYIFNYINEDVFFLWACEILRFKMPDVFHRKKLSIEFEEELVNTDDSNLMPCVYHGWHHNYHSINYALKFLMNSSYFTVAGGSMG